MANTAISNLNKDIIRPHLSPFKGKGFKRRARLLSSKAFGLANILILLLTKR